MTRKRLSIFGCHWFYMLLLWKFLSYALARHISCYQSTGFISTFYATSSFFFAEKTPRASFAQNTHATLWSSLACISRGSQTPGSERAKGFCRFLSTTRQKPSLKWPARRLMWSIRVPRRQNLNNFEQITSYFFKLSKVSEFVLSRRKIHNTSINFASSRWMELSFTF